MFAQQSSALYRCIDHRAPDDSCVNKTGELYCAERDSCDPKYQETINTLEYIFTDRNVGCDSNLEAFRLDLCHSQTNNLKLNDFKRCGKKCRLECISTLEGSFKVICNDTLNIMKGNWSIFHFTSCPSGSPETIALIDTDGKCTIIIQIHVWV